MSYDDTAWEQAQPFLLPGNVWWTKSKDSCILIIEGEHVPHYGPIKFALRPDGKIVKLYYGQMESRGKMMILTGGRWYIPEEAWEEQRKTAPIDR